MTLSLRQQHWIGGLTSAIVQAALFFPLVTLLGNFATAVIFIAVNVAFASTYRSSNPYLVGARWAAFFNLSWASYARHSYWYPYLMESMARLRDFDHPVGLTQKLCGGDGYAALVTGVTGLGIILFYSFVIRWPEWTGRWESLRRAPLSASLGLQTLFFTVVLYPTPWTVAFALFFAALISPLFRRQVRLNHVIFLSLLPLFSLGSQPVALIASLVAGFFFIYFAAFERSLSANAASFSVFSGVTFLALTTSIAENYALGLLPPFLAGVYALLSYALLVGVAYLLLFRGDVAFAWVQVKLTELTPQRLREASWWKVRDLWVDREVDHRVNKRYRGANRPKLTLALFFFGPREWVAETEDYERVQFPKLNYAASIIVLGFYSIWLLLDGVTVVSEGNFAAVALGLGLGFLSLMALPAIILVREFKKGRRLSAPTAFLGIVSLAIFVVFMGTLFYFGLSSPQQLDNQQGTAAAKANIKQLPIDTPQSCQAGR